MSKATLGIIRFGLLVMYASLSSCAHKKQEATRESRSVRQFKFVPTLDSLGAGQFIVASYNVNIIDTLDRILVSSFDRIAVKGRHLTVAITRIDILNYKVQLVDHRNFESTDPNEISGHYEQIEFMPKDTIDIAFSREVINPPSIVGIELNVKKTNSFGDRYEVFGRANLPVLDGNDFDNSYKRLPKQ